MLADFLVQSSNNGIPIKLIYRLINLTFESQRAEMFRAISVPFLERAQSLAAESSDLNREEFQRMYRGVLQGYLKCFVKKQPPAFQNWARDRVTCTCGDFWRLNLLLVSATQQVARFLVGENKRHHLHRILDNDRVVDCTHVTERIIPETLVVTKRDKAKATYDAWLSRCKEAHETLQRFDQDALGSLLGDQQ